MLNNLKPIVLITIATLTTFPHSAQAFPKNCGKFFNFNGKKHCVQTVTASSEGAVIDVFSPLPEAPKSTGYEYHQYRVLDVSCRTAKNPNQARISIVETRSVDSKGKVIHSNKHESPVSAQNEQLAWKAYLASCGKG